MALCQGVARVRRNCAVIVCGGRGVGGMRCGREVGGRCNRMHAYAVVVRSAEGVRMHAYVVVVGSADGTRMQGMSAHARHVIGHEARHRTRNALKDTRHAIGHETCHRTRGMV